VPCTFWSLPSTVTFATDEPLERVAEVWFDDPPELVDDLSLEHPDRPTITIAVAAAATVTEYFTRFSLRCCGDPSTLTDRFGSMPLCCKRRERIRQKLSCLLRGLSALRATFASRFVDWRIPFHRG
jgi:hypothetical protein